MDGSGTFQTERHQFVVPGMHCAGCMAKVERALKRDPHVHDARANLSTRRVSVQSLPGTDRDALLAVLAGIGYDAAPFDPRLVQSDEATRERELLKAMGVAGFAAANIMLLSVSVWAGLFSDMGGATRALFHWIAAAIALPTVVYAGRPFYRSAWGALQRGQMNMDVPISLAVILAAGASVMETIRDGDHVYFDASVSLLFFLLIGRFLDQRMRGRATAVAQNLMNLRAVSATVLDEDGSRRIVPAQDLQPGMRVLVAAGMRLPADGNVLDGNSHIDKALITGETTPEAVVPGTSVFAGTLNLDGPLQVEVTATDDKSLLADIVRLMEAAEQGKAAYVQLADRLVRYYAPGVHLLAAGTFAGWLLAGFGWHPALMAAIAVLIVTCPCALGLAVPVVQVVSCGRLLKRGLLVKMGDALERLARINHVVFDKTGTLTLDRLSLADPAQAEQMEVRRAASLAGHSSHPLSRALADAVDPLPGLDWQAVEEVPGQGLRAWLGGQEMRLGRRNWVVSGDSVLRQAQDERVTEKQVSAHPEERVTARVSKEERDDTGPELWLRDGETPAIRIGFHDTLRPDAKEVVADLQAQGLAVSLLSGDREETVKAVARQLGIEDWHAGVSPADKIAFVEQARSAGGRPLMVGDGLNDAPALAAASASLSPASASDISQTTADLVFQGEALSPVLDALYMARSARARILQNFALALGYNVIAVPLAAAGFVTPLIAAIAMSGSSLVVTLNAMRPMGRK